MAVEAVFESVSNNTVLNKLIDRCHETPNIIFSVYLTSESRSLIKLQMYKDNTYDLYIPSSNTSVKSPFITDIIDICEEQLI